MSQQSEDRLDRIERNLERHAEESNQRMAHLDRFLANFSNDVALNAAESNKRIASTEATLDRLAELLTRSYHQSNQRLDRIEELVARNGQQLQFLRDLTQGHISQPTPPAHSD